MEKLVLFSKAMADENRLKIVALIQREESLCVCEICDTLALSQPLVSRHLKQLKAVGVLQSKKKNKWMIYSIVDTPSTLLSAYLKVLVPNEEALGDIVSCKVRD